MHFSKARDAISKNNYQVVPWKRDHIILLVEFSSHACTRVTANSSQLVSRIVFVCDKLSQLSLLFVKKFFMETGFS